MLHCTIITKQNEFWNNRLSIC